MMFAIGKRILFGLMAASLCGAALAAEPQFKPCIVTSSYTYDHSRASFDIAGFPVEGGSKIPMSSVTVAVDGVLVTGEWRPKTPESPSSDDFRPGTEVLAAAQSTRLLLKMPDGSVVTAKVTYREKQKTPPKGSSSGH